MVLGKVMLFRMRKHELVLSFKNHSAIFIASCVPQFWGVEGVLIQTSLDASFECCFNFDPEEWDYLEQK